MRQQAALCSPLFQFAMMWGPRNLVQCTAVTIFFLLIIFKGAENGFIQLAKHLSHLTNTLLIAHQNFTSSVCRWRTSNSGQIKQCRIL